MAEGTESDTESGGINFDGGAPWAKDLQKKQDPNRVGNLQIPPGKFQPNPLRQIAPPDPATRTEAYVPAKGEAAAYDPNLPRTDEPSYYDISILKRPLWGWEIAAYFFLGGLSAGSYMIGRAADRFGSGPTRDLAKFGSFAALAAILPCPPLLIHDLGDPKRFHHMLRVWKPTSPMNLGTWVITAYSGVVTADVARHFLDHYAGKLGIDGQNKIRRMINDGKLLLVSDAAGVPITLLLASYTGMLLSASSNPLWSKNPWLSPLFTASAFATGAETLSLVLDCLPAAQRAKYASTQKALRRLDTLCHAAELTCMTGFSHHAGEKAAVLHTGEQALNHKTSMAGIIGSEALKWVPAAGELGRRRRMTSSLLGLVGGFFMRWSFIYGGHAAAADPHTARLASTPSPPKPALPPNLKRGLLMAIGFPILGLEKLRAAKRPIPSPRYPGRGLG